MKKPIIRLEDLDRKADHFNAPEGYFEDLPQRIQKKINVRKDASLSAWKNRWGTLFLKYATPALTVLLAVGLWQNYRTPAGTTAIPAAPMEALSHVSETQIRQYLSQHEIHEEDLLEIYTKHHAAGHLSEVELNIPDEAIEQALDEEDIDDL